MEAMIFLVLLLDMKWNYCYLDLLNVPIGTLNANPRKQCANLVNMPDWHIRIRPIIRDVNSMMFWQLFETHAHDIQNNKFVLDHPTHHWASRQAAPYDKKYCNFFLRIAKIIKYWIVVLIPKCIRTHQKKQKCANNPQKYAKTRKSKLFAISALFVLNMDLIWHN